MKRKRKTVADLPSKRVQRAAPTPQPGGVRDDQVAHPVLNRFYARVLSLRKYVLCKLPVSSRKRRRNIKHLGEGRSDGLAEENPCHDSEVCELLDTILIGVRNEDASEEELCRAKELVAFSQQLPESTVASDIVTGSLQLPEVRLFVDENTIGNSFMTSSDSPCS